MIRRAPFRVVAFAMLAALAASFGTAQVPPSQGVAASTARPMVPFTSYGDGTWMIPAFCVAKDTLSRDPHGVLGVFPRQHVRESDPIEVTLHEVGEFGFRRIVEVQYRRSFQEDANLIGVLHALYASDDAERYCLLLASERSTVETWFIEDRTPATRIVQAGGERALQFVLREGGTAHFLEEHYFLLENGEPVEVSFSEALKGSRSGFAPEGSRPRKGSTFCLADLQYRTGLWREEDPGCCGSAGALFVQFRLNGRRLEAMEWQLYRDYDEMREARGSWSCKY